MALLSAAGGKVPMHITVAFGGSNGGKGSDSMGREVDSVFKSLLVVLDCIV